MVAWSVFIVEDDEFARDNYSTFIKNNENFSLLGSTNTIEGVEDLIGKHQPDVVLMDIYFNENKNKPFDFFAPENAKGLKAGIKIKEQFNEKVGVLLNSISLAEDAVHLILDANTKINGGFGFMQKSNNRDTLFFALSQVAKGERFVDFKTCRTLIPSSRTSNILSGVLSNNEQKTLSLLGSGYTPQMIADKEFVSAATVYNTLQTIRNKLKLENIEICNSQEYNYIQLVHLAIAEGLSPIQVPRIRRKNDRNLGS
jgi:DNA-binding NarL/FixJ family response regulator